MIMIMINVGIKVKGMKRQLMNKNQFKIKLFKQVKHVNYKKKHTVCATNYHVTVFIHCSQ